MLREPNGGATEHDTKQESEEESEPRKPSETWDHTLFLAHESARRKRRPCARPAHDEGLPTNAAAPSAPLTLSSEGGRPRGGQARSAGVETRTRTGCRDLSRTQEPRKARAECALFSDCH